MFIPKTHRQLLPCSKLEKVYTVNERSVVYRCDTLTIVHTVTMLCYALCFNLVISNVCCFCHTGVASWPRFPLLGRVIVKVLFTICKLASCVEIVCRSSVTIIFIFNKHKLPVNYTKCFTLTVYFFKLRLMQPHTLVSHLISRNKNFIITFDIYHIQNTETTHQLKRHNNKKTHKV